MMLGLLHAGPVKTPGLNLAGIPFKTCETIGGAKNCSIAAVQVRLCVFLFDPDVHSSLTGPGELLPSSR